MIALTIFGSSRAAARCAARSRGLCAGLGGCANIGDSFASAAFVDPAKYEHYDCKQLEAERKSLATRTAELQGLMAKAETGTGGTVVAELAYRNDYIRPARRPSLPKKSGSATNASPASPAAPRRRPHRRRAPAPGKGHGSSRSGSASIECAARAACASAAHTRQS